MKNLGKRLTSLLLTVCLTVGLLAVPGFAAEPGEIPSQITLSLAGSTSEGTSAISFSWITDPETESSSVICGTDASLSDAAAVPGTAADIDGTDFEPAGYAEHVKAVRSFKATVTGLTPGRTYYYRIGSESGGYTDVASFTAPAAADDSSSFSFLVSADTQGETPEDFENTQELYNYLAENENDASFLIHTGDIVEDASYSDYWQYFFDAAGDLLKAMPFMATPGNHDSNSYDTNAVQFRARFNYNNLTAPEGLSDAAKGTVYSFEYGDALFLCLNSYLADENDEALQWQFLKDQCASTDKAWKIVYYHEAVYDPGSSHYQLDNEVGKKMTDAGVDLVLDGHEHAYARTTLRTTSEENGTGSIESAEPGQAPTYVIGGSVYDYAYSLSDSDTSWNDFFYDLRIDQSKSGGGAIYSPGVYARVDVSGNALVYTAYYKATGEDNGFKVIDTFTIRKSGDEIRQPSGSGEAPRSVTYLWDSSDSQNSSGGSDARNSSGGQDVRYSARFNWVTDTDITESYLFYAKKSDFDANGGKFTDVVTGRSEVIDLSESLKNLGYKNGTADYEGEEGAEYCYAPVQSHKAETAVLEPGTEYVYCVGDGSANTTSVTDPQVIKTPAADTDTFDFLFFTDAQQSSYDDNGGRYDVALDGYTKDMRAMLDRAVADYPDAAFIMSGGDQVNYGFDTWEWDAFFESSQDIFSKYPLYLSTGNHECDGAGNEWTQSGGDWTPVDQTCSPVLGRYNPPENGAAYYGGGESGTERMTSGVTKMEAMAGNYYFIYGDTLFLVLDYQDSTDDDLIAAQQDWVRSVVKNNPTKWRVAVMHKTLFGYRVSDPTTGVYRSWSDTFDDAGVDLVLMGHDHVYARTKYYADGAVTESQQPGSGTTYITGASANEDNRSGSYKENAYTLIHSTDDYGRAYVAISVSPEQITVTTKGIENGEVITVENNAVITDTARSYDLSDYTYPGVPEESDDLSVTDVSIAGYAKEGQTLSASATPKNATVSYQWETSSDGRNGWSPIDGANSSSYTVQASDVGNYLRCSVTGTGFYHGTVFSAATDKVTSLSGGGEVISIDSTDTFESFVKGFGGDDYPIDANYELTADLDLSQLTLSSIGDNNTPFLGTFNGNGHAISNLKIDSDAGSVGLFAYIGAGGRVVNTVLKDVSVTAADSDNTGAIAGACAGTIENCSVTGTVSGNGTVAGVVGRLHGGTVKNCSVDVTVNATGNTASALIGSTNTGGPITVKNDETGNIVLNNLVRGTVNGADYAGAVVGDMGGSGGCPLQTFTGNVIDVTVNGTDGNVVAGYWSSGRPILDENQKNGITSGLSADGINNQKAKETFETIEKSALSSQDTYENLGWDFDSAWTWDSGQNLPVPAVLTVVSGDGLMTISASAGRGGSISPSGNVLVETGKDQTFTIVPDEYYTIDSVLIDGVENEKAAASGSYTFENVTSLHSVDVTFRLSDDVSGRAPSLVSESAFYNKTQKDHIDLTVDFGEGALGIPESDRRKCVDSVRIMKDGETIFDCESCYWFPSHGNPGEPPAELFQICYDDMEKKPEYENLVPGTYDLAITFNDLQATTCTIPLTVVDAPVHQLTVSGGTFEAIGALDDTDSKIAEGTAVTVTADTQSTRFEKWEITGLSDDINLSANPLTFTMPQEDVSIRAVFASSTGSSGHSGGSSSRPNKNPGQTSGETPGDQTSQPGDPSGQPGQSISFSDVSTKDWFSEAVGYVSENGIMNGIGNGSFRPQATTTRGMIVTMLYRLEGEPKAGQNAFRDVASDTWYSNAIAWASENDIAAGYGDGNFGPNDTITREQIATILYRYASFKGYDMTPSADLSRYADTSQISGYALSAMQWANTAGLINGTTDTTLNPKGNATRAEVAMLMMRFCETVANTAAQR